MDELDEFNEAPHSLRSEANSRNGIRSDGMENIDLDDDDDDEQNQISILDRTIPGRIAASDLLSGSEAFAAGIDDVDLLITDTSKITAPSPDAPTAHARDAQQAYPVHPNLDMLSNSSSSSDIDRHIFSTVNQTGDLDDVRIMANASKSHQHNRRSNNQNM